MLLKCIFYDFKPPMRLPLELSQDVCIREKMNKDILYKEFSYLYRTWV